MEKQAIIKTGSHGRGSVTQCFELLIGFAFIIMQNFQSLDFCALPVIHVPSVSLCQSKVRVSVPLLCFLLYFDSPVSFVNVFSFASTFVQSCLISPRCVSILFPIPSLFPCVFRPFVFLCLLSDCLHIIHVLSPCSSSKPFMCRVLRLLSGFRFLYITFVAASSFRSLFSVVFVMFRFCLFSVPTANKSSFTVSALGYNFSTLHTSAQAAVTLE